MFKNKLKDGISLKSMEHPSLSNDSIEQIEIEIPDTFGRFLAESLDSIPDKEVKDIMILCQAELESRKVQGRVSKLKLRFYPEV
jgi:hypothetical protein